MGGWELLPIHSFKWNPNNAFTTWKRHHQGPCLRICLLILRITWKSKINGFEKERRDCLSLLCFDNSKIYSGQVRNMVGSLCQRLHVSWKYSQCSSSLTLCRCFCCDREVTNAALVNQASLVMDIWDVTLVTCALLHSTPAKSMHSVPQQEREDTNAR